MVPSVAEVIGRFKSDWSEQIQSEAVHDVCSELQYSWRERLLSPVTTIQLFILQVLNGNTACTHLTHLSELRFSAAAYCQARKRLPLQLFQTLLERLCFCLKNLTMADGKGIVFFSSTAQAYQCRTLRSCFSNSGNRRSRILDADFLSHTYSV